MSESYIKYIVDIVRGREAIFEIQDGEKHYAIYANGNISGFSNEAFIFNKIPFVTRHLPEIFQDRTPLPDD